MISQLIYQWWWQVNICNTFHALLEQKKKKKLALISCQTTFSWDYSTHSLWHNFIKAYVMSKHSLLSEVALIFLQDIGLMMGELDCCVKSSLAHPKDYQLGWGLESVMDDPYVKWCLYSLSSMNLKIVILEYAHAIRAGKYWWKSLVIQFIQAVSYPNFLDT